MKDDDPSLNRALSVAKWICLLESSYQGKSKPTKGTGFLVNIPNVQKLCVLTAAHNLQYEGKRATSIKVTFTELQPKVEWTANDADFFYPESWKSNPNGDKNFANDWGLILGDLSNDTRDEKNAFGFMIPSVAMTDTSLKKNYKIKVHGYPEDKRKVEDAEGVIEVIGNGRIEYKIKTEQGVSGGPAWISRLGRYPTVVGVHNYHKKASQITLKMVRQIYTWAQPHLAANGTVKLDAIVKDQNSETRLNQTGAEEVATLFGASGDNKDTKFDILPGLVFPSDDQSEEYLYIITPVRANDSDPPFFLALGPEQSRDSETRKLAHFAKEIKKDSTTFYIEPKGESGAFTVTSFDKSMIFRIKLPENQQSFACDDVTPRQNTADFITNGDETNPGILFVKDK